VAFPTLEEIIEAVNRLNITPSGNTIRSVGLWHVLIFLRHRRIAGGEQYQKFGAYDLAQACFDIVGINLPIDSTSDRDVYYEPAATQGSSPSTYFRHFQGPRQTFLNRIYDGLTGRGVRQPALFQCDSHNLPVNVRLTNDWITEIRSIEANKLLLDNYLPYVITWLFRFGVPVKQGLDTTSYIANNGAQTGLLTVNPETEFREIATKLPDLKLQIMEFLGLSEADLESLMPMLNTAQYTWAGNVPVATSSLKEPLVQSVGVEVPPLPSGQAVAQIEQLEEDTPSFADADIAFKLDERIERMVRLSIASANAVMLVGPPGTGKTTILRQIIKNIKLNPSAYGLRKAPDVKWVTPEESWTTRDLLGGETVDENSDLRFRPGHVLDAIKKNQWIVLDEANRADMDKIFGGLLTWLSGQAVELGKVSTEVNAPSVLLNWNRTADCSTQNIEALNEDSEKPDQPVVFSAGTEWRLLGTYNALDAQRVFRFGQALGRRFVRVPIPAMSPTSFKIALTQKSDGLTDDLIVRVSALYAAHFESSATQLGPALFFWLPEYVKRGLIVSVATNPDSIITADQLTTADEVTDISGTTDGVLNTIEATAHTSLLGNYGTTMSVNAISVEKLLAEAYLAGVGVWLAKLEDSEREGLGQRIIDAGVFPRAEWEWINELLPALA
jgi:MoxR-like ATPase